MYELTVTDYSNTWCCEKKKKKILFSFSKYTLCW